MSSADNLFKVSVYQAWPMSEDMEGGSWYPILKSSHSIPEKKLARKLANITKIHKNSEKLCITISLKIIWIFTKKIPCSTYIPDYLANISISLETLPGP